MEEQKKQTDEHFALCDDRRDHVWQWTISQAACTKCGLTKEVTVTLPDTVVEKIKTKQSTLLDPKNTLNTSESKILKKPKNK